MTGVLGQGQNPVAYVLDRAYAFPYASDNLRAGHSSLLSHPRRALQAAPTEAEGHMLL